MGTSVSAALIVRDEADHLAECLACVVRFVDEIRIVDTGSTDATRDVARRFGVEPESFPWCGDFAAARNRSLELCQGDWIFVIDADERIDPADAPVLRRLTAGPPDRGYRFTTRNYTHRTDLAGFRPCPPSDGHGRGFAGWFPSVKVRLFPNRPEIRFEGAVHELVNPSMERLGLPLCDSEVPVHHYPLLHSAERVRRKQELYVELGIRKARERPDDPQAHAELGHQYAELGKYARALGAYREALHRDPQNATVLRDMGAVLHLAGHDEEARRALELAVRIDPDSTEAWRNLGVVHSALGDWSQAAECFERALDRDPDWIEGIRSLSVALEACGRREEACAAARRAFEAAPYDPACIDNFVGQMIRLGRGDALRSLLEGATESPYLRETLDRLDTM